MQWKNVPQKGDETDCEVSAKMDSIISEKTFAISVWTIKTSQPQSLVCNKYWQSESICKYLAANMADEIEDSYYNNPAVSEYEYMNHLYCCNLCSGDAGGAWCSHSSLWNTASYENGNQGSRYSYNIDCNYLYHS